MKVLYRLCVQLDGYVRLVSTVHLSDVSERGGEERGDGEDERREGIGRGEDRGVVMAERRKDCVKGGE